MWLWSNQLWEEQWVMPFFHQSAKKEWILQEKIDQMKNMNSDKVA